MAYSKIIDILSGLFLLFHFPSILFDSSSIIRLPLPAPGPEAFGFDLNGEGPYTSITDGRVVKYEGPEIGFVGFAYTAPNRSSALCDGINTTDLIDTCGRPLGLRFYYRTGELFLTDAIRGLCVVGPEGGLATQLAAGVDGVPFRSPDGVEVDQSTGTVYFTEASAVYNLTEAGMIYTTGDSTGRVLKYDPETEEVTVLASNLSGAAGVAVSEDGSFLLFSEVANYRIQKYWFTGPKANTYEVFLNFTGSPNKIKRTIRGDFWVAVTDRTVEPHILLGYRFDGSGNILETLTFSPEFDSSLITEVEEFDGSLYLGSLNLTVDYVAVYNYNSAGLGSL